jgi:hypothetical protein
MQGYWTLKPLQTPLTEGKLIFLAKAFHLSKKHYFCWLQTYLLSSLCSWSYFLFNWEHSGFYFLYILLDKGVSSFRLKLFLQNTLQIIALEPLPKQRLR